MTKRKAKAGPETSAFERAVKQVAPSGGATLPADAEYRQELAIHQVELELQNEELRATRLELEAGLDRYTQLFDFAPIGYATVTADGTVRELNHVGAGLIYESRSRLIGKRFGMFVAPSDRAAFYDLLDKVVESDDKETRELHLNYIGDEQPIVRLTAVTLAGTEPTILIAFEDITPQKRAEERLVRADLALREADRRKDEFLAVLSHELRTPLSTLLMYGQLLRHGGLEAEQIKTAADAIERAARIQARLIDDLLDVSRIIAGKLNMRVYQVNLVSIARAALETVKKDAEQKRISVETTFDAALPTVAGDSGRLQQVITNLLANAVKFTPSGGRVGVRLRAAGGEAELQVEDTGAGIDPDFLPYIFDRFSQADRTITRTTGGLGLGLSIAKSIVEAHHGTIRVQSAGRGRGSTFTVSLPVRLGAREALLDHGTALAKNAAKSKIEGMRLLVVEDDAITRQTLTDVLTRAGAEVRDADGGAAAMRVLSHFHPDVLVCDIGMPEEDGCALLRRIRARDPEHGADVRALALTAFAGDEDRQRTKEAGFQTHLVKPIDIDQLVTAVAALLPSAQARVH